MEREDWDRRYAAQEIAWEARPAGLLAEELGGVPAGGRALDLGCGRGRNAVWLAELGWKVTAVDYSGVALDHARQLAAARRVTVDWIEADVTNFEPPRGAFQLVVIAYLQLPGPDRRRVLSRAAAALAPQGTLFMIGHALLNLTEGTGGPKDPELLWDPPEIRRELLELGLAVRRVEHVRRVDDGEDGGRTAVDTVARAEQVRRRRRADEAEEGR